MALCGAGHRGTFRAWLRERVARELGVDPEGAALDAAIENLGIESVELVGLICELEERSGRRIPLELLGGQVTIDALARYAETGEVLEADPAISGARSDSAHPFIRHVNPSLGRRMEAVGLAKRFVRGEGCYLYDSDGHRYLDFLSSYGALPFGYNPPEIWRALCAVRDNQEPSFVTPSFLDPAGLLAERLLGLATPNLSYATFTNSGAEAIEAAIKLCRLATGRSAILSAEGGFHGKTLGAISATGNARYHACPGLPAGGFDRVPFGDATALRRAIELQPDTYAAFIVEPIQGEGGVVPAPPGYLAEAQHICRGDGILFVLDEIQTGLGRTGSLFASLDERVSPDVLALGKALGGGLVPIAALLYSETAYSDQFGLDHSSTFAGGTLACRVGLATLDILERGERAILRHVTSCGDRLKSRLEELRADFPDLISDVRGRGFMLGMEFGLDRRTQPNRLLGVAGEQNFLAAIVSGFLANAERIRLAPTLSGANVVRIAPPLTATWADCELFLAALGRALPVLDAGDSGRVFGAILGGTAREWSPPALRPVARGAVEAKPGERKFAFLIHPLTPEHYAHFDDSLAGLEPHELREVANRLSGVVDPFRVSSVRIRSEVGSEAFGEFILLPYTAKALLALPHERAVSEVRRALDLARDRGAELVGLGAYTSVVTRGGLDLRDPGIALTSGNSYTAVAGLAALDLAAERLGQSLSSSTAAIVGATGAIGGATAALLAEKAARLLLVGNPTRSGDRCRSALRDVAARACGHVIREARSGRAFARGSLGRHLAGLAEGDTDDLEWLRAIADELERGKKVVITQDADAALPLADVVVTATSSTEPIVTGHNLRSGALVCDLSQPPNVDELVRSARPDVLVIDGGVVEVPGRPELGPFGLPAGLAFACMAETMILSLEGRLRDASLGPALDLDEMLEIRNAAAKHGFRVAEIRSFDDVMDPSRWEQLLAARSQASLAS